MSRIFSLLGFFIFGVIGIFAYFADGAHRGLFGSVEKFATDAPLFLLIMALLGWLGVWWSIARSPKNTASLSLMTLLGGFVLSLFFVSCFTLIQAEGTLGAGFVLFFKVIGFLFLPLGLVLIGTGLGRWILQILDLVEEVRPMIWAIETIVGLCILIALIAFLGFIPGGYSLWVIGIVLVLSIALTYRDIWSILTDIWKFRFTSPVFHSPIIRTLYVVIAGVFLMILFFTITTNLVNIVRPFPIGWDDLGAYMNFPKLMAYALSTSHQGMAFWQVFTGIGFLFDSPTQAFFFNQVGTLLTVLTLYSGISYFTVKKPNLLPYPIIATTIFCSMPMVVFQQAKDMKLDLALFAVSIISVMLVFFALSSTRRSAMLRLMGLAGVLAGIAFSIKFTSIMIMIGTIGMFFYARLGLAGLLGFTSIFVGVFTRLHLWSLLNVNYPATSPWLNIFGYGMIALGIVLIGVGIYKSQEKKYVSIFLIPVLIYSLGIGVAIGPWIVKNLIESRTISVTGLLYGDIRVFSPDYTLVYTPEKLESIKNLGNVSQISDSGTTLNEDLGRYFGYESGINNYLKLPINLTTQKNQWGEFTDITYLYLVLLPGSLLLIVYRKRWSLALAGGFVVFLGIYYFIPSFTGYISAFFGGSSTTSSALLQNFSALGNYLGATSLPTGYLWILGIFSIPLWIIHFDQRSTPESKNLRYLVVLTTLYTLLFVVAAFGIVWYGILMYFLFLALIVHIISPLTVIENEDHEPIGLGIGLGLLILILPYFLHSGIPNTWNNLPEDSFEYKSGKITGLEATFSRREEYLSTLSKINLLSPTPVLDELKKEVTQDDLRTLLENIPSDTPLDQVVNILVEKESIASTSPAYQGFALEARKLRNLIYERIVHPTDDNKNSQKILRIGTFLTYYISENRSRYFDDSLIFEFSRYLHDTDSKVTLDRLKKLGVRYMLVDLNAATIDRDPARNLTKRYESLIETLDDPGLSLITTDSPCLRMALEKKWDDYLPIAGVNYVSQVTQKDGKVGYLSPDRKMDLCASVLTRLIWTRAINDTAYTYFKPLSDAVWTRTPKSEQEIFDLVRPRITRGWFAAFEIR